MILTAGYFKEDEYKLPDNLDLEDKSIVKTYDVKDLELYIHYTTEEYYRQYSGSDEPSEDNKHIQTIIYTEYGEPDWENPDEIDLVPAGHRCIDYTDDEEDDDQEIGRRDLYCDCEATKKEDKNNDKLLDNMRHYHHLLEEFREYCNKLKDIKTLDELRAYESEVRKQGKWWTM